MLKLITKALYHNNIYTAETELFYKIYKYQYGLYFLISFRKLIFSIICWLIGFTLYNYTFKKINSLIFFDISAVLFVLHIYEQKRIIKCQKLGLTAHAQLKTEKIHDFMMKLINLNGKALGRANQIQKMV